jgi:group I intron endonuclease
MEKRFHYVYITTNLIDGKQYVGDHFTNRLEDGYLGSGVYFNNAIKKYGKENFVKTILEMCDSSKDAFYLQEKYILQYNTLSPNGYNISPKGGHGVSGCYSEETKKKLGKIWKGRKHSQETKNKISKKLKGRIYSEEAIINMRNGAIGKKLSEETKQKMSESHKGKLKGRKLTEETKQKMSISRKGRISPMKGKHMSEDAKRKLSEKHKGKKLSPATKEKISKNNGRRK